jgi:hypothetical protein
MGILHRTDSRGSIGHGVGKTWVANSEFHFSGCVIYLSLRIGSRLATGQSIGPIIEAAMDCSKKHSENKAGRILVRCSVDRGTCEDVYVTGE